MLIKTLTVGPIATNCHVVTDEDTRKCAVIDPGGESVAILDYIEANKLTVEAILITHGHFDHHMALRTVAEETGAPTYIHKSDATDDDRHDRLKLRNDGKLRFYAEGDAVEVGALRFEVMETPGHSPGSVTLRCGDALFTGDTLFRDSCGRTDLDGGDMDILLKSLLRIASLDGDFEVYPGHDMVTSLDRERGSNYYIRYARGEYKPK
jgi:glyoxylase-like metal-dependent hydrolase (beta-lactamase superfamily II)